MDDHQTKELLENLEAWGEEFRSNQHGATLTILRAKKTIADQVALIAQLKTAINHGATVRARTILADRCKHDAGRELNGVGMWICLGCRADISQENADVDATPPEPQ